MDKPSLGLVWDFLCEIHVAIHLMFISYKSEVIWKTVVIWQMLLSRVTGVHSSYTFSQYACSLGSEPVTFCTTNAVLYQLSYRNATTWDRRKIYVIVFCRQMNVLINNMLIWSDCISIIAAGKFYFRKKQVHDFHFVIFVFPLFLYCQLFSNIKGFCLYFSQRKCL